MQSNTNAPRPWRNRGSSGVATMLAMAGRDHPIILGDTARA
ncbi:hypothetical protein [Achromobacter agilis]|nr:hypothetical protein [Achromobacter agilis]